ncbi:hypothetical protein HGT73_09435 [Rosenbergiella australiborealis]|uniref:VOC domain-containing protein n=1 Tax=Rosenbergiella australiborealis TaxID=1544696 RepID=A0ABS5T5I3_9GAMM|nr:hypothetical protein [Rosenbergiella australiborealis]
MLTDLNHITLAVGDLSKSIDFYVNTLGFTRKARWSQGAYCSGQPILKTRRKFRTATKGTSIASVYARRYLDIELRFRLPTFTNASIRYLGNPPEKPVCS